MTNCTVIFVEEHGERQQVTFSKTPQEGDVFTLEGDCYQVNHLDNEFVYAVGANIIGAQYTEFFVHPDYRNSDTLDELQFNPAKNEEYQPGDDDLYTLEDFIKMAEAGGITMFDGFADEVIIAGRIVQSSGFAPEDLLKEKSLWLRLQEEKGLVSIIWYNK